jgi:FMN-dependent NADH-azoreductase
MKLLHLDSSILGPGSVSRHLSAAIVTAQQALNPGLEVVRRDLATDPVDHLSGLHLAAAQGATPATDALQNDVAAGQAAMAEFLAADIVVIGAPMYNFSIPSQLKAWIDRIAVAGVTFRYSETGPEGLAGGKKLIIASSRGGFYGAESAASFLDHQETYLRGVFGFLGITDISFIRAEGIGLGEPQRQQAIDTAEAEIRALPA